MILLRSKNLLFFKSRKTAGTSIEIALSSNSDDSDIITPISIQDELLRLEDYGVGPKNWATTKDIETRYLETLQDISSTTEKGSDARKSAIRQLKANQKPLLMKHRRFFNHIPPHMVREQNHLPDFEAVVKITATRHPYEQLVSHAYFKAKSDKVHENGHHLTEEIEMLLSRPSPNRHYYFEKDGTAICDFYIRYENLRDDLQTLEQKFDLCLLKNLPFTKHKNRVDRLPAKEILTDNQKKRCYERCRAEFEFFGYQP